MLHTYVLVHSGTFDGGEKKLLRTFLSAAGRAWARLDKSESELGLGADELQALENAIA